jgi:hypothetical protein
MAAKKDTYVDFDDYGEFYCKITRRVSDDQKHGLEECYYRGDNGDVLMHKGRYKDGVQTGLWRTYYESGKLHQETTFKLKGISHLKEYNEDGTLKSIECFNWDGVVDCPDSIIQKLNKMPSKMEKGKYESMKVTELKREAKNRGIKQAYKFKKADLVAALNKINEESEDAKKKYQSMKVADLKKKAQEKGIKRAYKLKKAELVEELLKL